MTYEEAAQAKAEIDAAVALYRQDPRFRAMAVSTAHLVVDEHGPIDLSDPEREAYRIALTSALTMLARVYWRDEEIARLKHERDLYKQGMEQLVLTRPTPKWMPGALA